MLIKINIEAWASWPGSSGPWPPYFFEIIDLSEILMFCRKIFGLLVLKKIEVLNFIGKSFNLTPLLLSYYDASALKDMVLKNRAIF